MAGKLLTKGANVALPKDVDELNVGLSWDAPGPGYDLDAWTFALGADGRVLSDDYFVFFNNMASPCGSIRVSEDNQEGGSAEEDDEVVTVRLGGVPAAVQRIVFLVNIYEARSRLQSFGSLDNASIRLFSPRTGEVTRYNLGRGDTSTEASLVFGELYRHGGGWKFRAIAQGSDRGPGALVREYGVEVDDEPEGGAAAPVAAAPPAEPISLAKGRVELTKPGAKISMTKTPAMEFSVYWTKPDKDLGLILHVAYSDGRRTYFDWGNLTDKLGAIVHHGDRVQGGADVREHATIRFDRDPDIAAVAVIAYSELSNGIGSFKSMGAHAVVDDGAGNFVTVDLDKGGTYSYHTVIAVITSRPDGTILVERTSRFSASGAEERPEVDRFGAVSMNTGPCVFKDVDWNGF
jgi:tellurium resistance protein TerD